MSERPRGAAAKKTHTTQGVFFCCRVVFFFLLRPRRVFLENSKKCLGYYIGSKKTRRGHKNTTSTPPRVFFFLLRPRRKAREGEAPLEAGTGPEQKKKHHPGCFFFLLRPRGKAGEGVAPPGLFRPDVVPQTFFAIL